MPAGLPAASNQLLQLLTISFFDRMSMLALGPSSGTYSKVWYQTPWVHEFNSAPIAGVTHSEALPPNG